ncbi:hypothetical protein OIV83_003246 [Microbotryomycetes sp. JL201]|nr:hypothetical protein OIV83_003246 [Microbotryomycetes sp. JL201]
MTDQPTWLSQNYSDWSKQSDLFYAEHASYTVPQPTWDTPPPGDGGDAQSVTAWDENVQHAQHPASKGPALHDWDSPVQMNAMLKGPRFAQGPPIRGPRSQNYRVPHHHPGTHQRNEPHSQQAATLQDWQSEEQQSMVVGGWPAETLAMPSDSINLAAAVAWDELLHPGHAPIRDASTSPTGPSASAPSSMVREEPDRESSAIEPQATSNKPFVRIKNRKAYIGMPHEYWPPPLDGHRQPLGSGQRANVWRAMFDGGRSFQASIQATSRQPHPDELPLECKPKSVDICLGTRDGWQDVWTEMFANLLQNVQTGPHIVREVQSRKPVVLESQAVSEESPSRRASIDVAVSPRPVIALSRAGARALEAPFRDAEDSIVHAPTPQRPMATGDWVYSSTHSPIQETRTGWFTSSPGQQSRGTEGQKGFKVMPFSACARAATPFSPPNAQPKVSAGPQGGRENDKPIITSTAQYWVPCEDLFSEAGGGGGGGGGGATSRRLHGPRPLEPTSSYVDNEKAPVRVLYTTNPDPVPTSPACLPLALSSQSAEFASPGSSRVESASSLMNSDAQKNRRPLPTAPGETDTRYTFSTPPDGRPVPEPRPLDEGDATDEQDGNLADEEDIASTIDQRSIQEDWVSESSKKVLRGAVHAELASIRQELQKCVSESHQVAEVANKAVEQALCKLDRAKEDGASKELSWEQVSGMLEQRLVDEKTLEKVISGKLSQIEQQMTEAIESTLSSQLSPLRSHVESFTKPSSDTPGSAESIALKTELEAAVARVELYRAAELDLVSRLAGAKTRTTALERDLHHTSRETALVRNDRDRLRLQLEAMTADYKTACTELKAVQLDSLSAERVLTVEKEAHAATKGQVIVLEKRIADLDARLESALGEQALTGHLLKAAEVELSRRKHLLSTSEQVHGLKSERELVPKAKRQNSMESVKSAATVIFPSSAESDSKENLSPLRETLKEPLLVQDSVSTVDHFDLSPSPSQKSLQEDEAGWWSETEK